jgi:hypothetical protein
MGGFMKHAVEMASCSMINTYIAYAYLLFCKIRKVGYNILAHIVHSGNSYGS